LTDLCTADQEGRWPITPMIVQAVNFNHPSTAAERSCSGSSLSVRAYKSLT